MSRRIIEEAFRAIAPRGRRGIPAPAPITTGFTDTGVVGALSTGGPTGASGSSGDLNSSLSQAAQQISKLQSAYQQQATLIAANTQALQGNTSAQAAHSGSAAGQVASSFLGGALGFLSPVISGIASLFGGGSQTPAPLNIYTPPAPVQISGSLGAYPAATVSAAASPPNLNAAPAAVTSMAAPAPQAAVRQAQNAASQQITVNISAMDSQSFMDRSTDIANAVREAMLNMHPINNVIANL